jgi:hypothetical protein
MLGALVAARNCEESSHLVVRQRRIRLAGVRPDQRDAAAQLLLSLMRRAGTADSPAGPARRRTERCRWKADAAACRNGSSSRSRRALVRHRVPDE